MLIHLIRKLKFGHEAKLDALSKFFVEDRCGFISRNNLTILVFLRNSITIESQSSFYSISPPFVMMIASSYFSSSRSRSIADDVHSSSHRNSGCLSFIDNRPQFQEQLKLSQHISHKPVMQCLKKHAEKLGILPKGQEVTKLSVARYVNDTNNSRQLRINLLLAWNKGELGVHIIPRPKDLMSATGGVETGGFITRSDSVEALKMDYQGTLRKALSPPTLTLQTEDGTQTQVPVFHQMTTAIKMVRAFGAQGPLTAGAQFALQIGDNTGLYEAPRKNDMVFTPLKEIDTGIYQRDGSIENWTDQAARIDSEFEDKTSFKADLISTARGGFTPHSGTLFNTAGMMSCDAKTSITGYVICLDDLETSEETDPLLLFSSASTYTPVWEPSAIGGRQIPAYKKTTWEKQMLKSDNVFIDEIVQHFTGKPADNDQILLVRRVLQSDGSPMLQNENTIEKIMTLLDFKKPEPFNPDEFFDEDFTFTL